MINAVSIDKVSKNYGTVQALSNITFDIPQGSFFGLLGPNGAGKSTLINIMAGLLYANQGNIRIMGHDVRQQWRQSRHSIGIVPQELVFDPFFTLEEMLTLQAGYFGHGRENRAWIDELLTILSLNDKRKKRLQQLSGGMKRRALIAQALVHKPPVVVLDEPTAGVDVELRKMLWAFTRQLHQSGHTIILTTHYLEEAESLCERIAILNKGELVALDNTSTLLARYPYRLLHLNLASTNISLPENLRDKIYSYTNDMLILRLHCQQDSIGAVLESLRAEGIYFKDLHTEEPKLEEVFLNLTRN